MLNTDEYLNILNNFTSDLMGINDPQSLCWYVAKEVVGKLGYIDCVIYTFDRSREVLVQTAAVGPKNPTQHIIINPLKVPISEGITGITAKTQTARIINDIAKNEHYLKDVDVAGSELCVPILYEGVLYGVIDSEHPDNNHFDDRDLEKFTEIAKLLGAKLAQIILDKRSRERIKIIDHIHDIIIMSDQDGLITFVNAYGQDCLGYPQSEILGMDLGEIIVQHGDYDIWRQQIIDDMVADGAWSGRVKIISKDRSLHHYDSRSTLRLGDKTEDLGAIHVLRNIDELIISEIELKRHATIFETVNDAILMFDVAAKIIDCNEKAATMMGYTKEQMIGMSSAEFAVDQAEWEQGLNDAMTALMTNGNFVGLGRAKNPSGKEFPIEVSMTIYNGQKGRPIGTVAVIRDLTESTKIQDALIDAKQIAEHANKAKSSFLANMSHEIRTPLNAIIGFSEALEMGVWSSNSEKEKESLRIIADAGKHLNNLLADILDFSTIEAGKITLKPEPVHPSEIFKGNLLIIQQLVDKYQLTFEGIKETTKLIYVDPVRLNQIIINLISNASKYNKPGGKIEFGCYEAPNTDLKIYVKDTGVGISDEDKKLLFSPFDRGYISNPELHGVGLGLSICKQLTEDMGGTIGFESELGKGSTFWVQFPTVESSTTNLMN